MVEALALVVSALPAEQRRAGLEALLSPIMAALHACLHQPPLPPANGHVLNGTAAPVALTGFEQATPLVDRMTIVFRFALERFAANVLCLLSILPYPESHRDCCPPCRRGFNVTSLEVALGQLAQGHFFVMYGQQHG